MKKLKFIKAILIVAVCQYFASCQDYVEVEIPDHKIVREAVFRNDETALSAMKGVYNELFRSSFTNGSINSITALAGLSAHEVENLNATNFTVQEFEENQIRANNAGNLSLWSSAYNMIYMVNSLLEGITDSEQLSEDVHRQLEGEAKFVRAFTYFYLVNLYGDIPLLLTTDYRVNALAPRNATREIYSQINTDLQQAVDLLDTDYPNGERTYVNQYVIMALWARVNLYQENWEQAENLASKVIHQSDTYEILENLDQVFMMNSREAIWQISPIGRGNQFTNTNDGALYISPIPSLRLSDQLAGSFNDGDKRLEHWIGFNGEGNTYYPYKYKDGSSNNSITEYSMVFRLAELYLVRAEARTMQGKLPGAIADIDRIRSRANLGLIAEIRPGITKEELRQAILDERRKELFTEWGHRWFDLKRTEKASEVLGSGNPLWDATDTLFPIPDEERLKNPNLNQNPGY